MKIQRKVTTLLMASIGVIVVAIFGCTADDQSTSSTSIKEIEIPSIVWDILQESENISSGLKLGGTDELLELFEQAPKSWEGKIMRAQALDTSFQKKKALEVYIEVAKKYGNRAEPWIGIGKLCLDAAIADMTQRQLFTQKKGRYVFNPDKKSYDILLLARKYLSRANTLHVTPQERSSQAAVYLFSPDRAESLLRQVYSMIARYWLLEEKDAKQRGDEEGALQAFVQRMALKPDIVEKLKSLHKAAERGDADSQLNLGLMYVQGRDVKHNYSEAAKWFRRSAEQGNATAQYNIGLMYNAGRGVPKDDTEAVKWTRLSAEQGNAEGQYFLGLLYEGGSGVSQDSAEALNWIRRAAEQGYDMAQDHLGELFATGHGVTKDNTEAAKWFRRAAEQGLAMSQYKLGVAYVMGRGLRQSDAKAVKWFHRAAEQNYADAQFSLGFMYIFSRGVEQDLVQAYMWDTLAVQNSKHGERRDGFIKSRDEVAEKLTPAQLNRAQEMVKNWRPSSP